MRFINYKESGYRHDLDLLLSRTNCVFHILQEVGAERKRVHIRPGYLLD